MITRRLAFLGSVAALVTPAAVAAPVRPSPRLMTDEDLIAYLDPMTSHRGITSVRAASFNRDLADRLRMPNVFPDDTLRRARLDTRYTLEVAYDGRMPEGTEQEILDALFDAMVREINTDLPEMTGFVAVIPHVVIDPMTCDPVAVFRLHYIT